MLKHRHCIIIALAWSCSAHAELIQPITFFERGAGLLSEAPAVVANDRPYLAVEFLIDKLKLERKALPDNRVGICREDRCIPFTFGEGADDARRAEDREFIPAEKLITALDGRSVWDAADRTLLVDLRPHQSRTRPATEEPIDFALTDLSGKPVSLSEYRGRKIILFAWASW